MKIDINNRKFKIAAVISGVVLVIAIALVSPIFYVQEVVVQGNNRVTDSEIRASLALSSTSNILFFNTDDARRRVMSNLYIGNVTFRRSLPGRLYVTVFERRPSAYVEHPPGTFLFLDEYGRVIDVRPYLIEALPLLEGLQFTRWQLGEILEVPDETDFAAVVHYTQLLITHDLIHRITHMNVSDPSNIRILVNYIEFHVGSVSDADTKVRTIAAMLDEIPDRLRGFVDLQEVRSEYFFELLQ